MDGGGGGVSCAERSGPVRKMWGGGVWGVGCGVVEWVGWWGGLKGGQGDRSGKKLVPEPSSG